MPKFIVTASNDPSVKGSPHFVFASYGRAPFRELAERLIGGDVDMFLSSYGPHETPADG